MKVEVSTDVKVSYCQGRNGLFPIKELHVWTGDNGLAYIDGIGRRDSVLNGGFGLDVAAKDKLAAEWVAKRAKKA